MQIPDFFRSISEIWHNELFNGKGLKAKHIIFVGLFQKRYL
jgi:hypothetical protein